MLNNNELDHLAIKYGTDKSSNGHNYTRLYHFYFKNIRNQVENVLEIGVARGFSLHMWADYFPNATIHGIDVGPHCKQYEENRIKIHIGDGTDELFLKETLSDIKFDIIIDDGSHLSLDQYTSFIYLFPYLTKYGFYIIEDIGELDSIRGPGKSLTERLMEHTCFIVDRKNTECQIFSIQYFKNIVFILKDLNDNNSFQISQKRNRI